jgi:hypothetical protein
MKNGIIHKTPPRFQSGASAKQEGVYISLRSEDNIPELAKNKITERY